MLHEQTIRYFALDLLTLAALESPSWGHIEATERLDDERESATAIKVVAPGVVRHIELHEVPPAARQVVQHRLASPRLRFAVLDQDARGLLPVDAHAVVQQLLYRSIRF